MSDFEIIENELGLDTNNVYDEPYETFMETGEGFVLTGELREPDPGEPFLGLTTRGTFEGVFPGMDNPCHLGQHNDYGQRRPILEPIGEDNDE